jgi:hypothetical protein
MTQLRPAPPPVAYSLDELRQMAVRANRKADWSAERWEIRRQHLIAKANGDEGLLRILKRDDTELNEAAGQLEYRIANATRLAVTLANELKMREMGLL